MRIDATWMPLSRVRYYLLNGYDGITENGRLYLVRND